MLKFRRALAPLTLVLAVAALPLAQERVSRKAPPTFGQVHGAIGAAFKSGDYRLALQKTKELMSVIAPKVTEAILASFPGAPENFEILPQPKQNQQANQMLAAMSAAVGTVVEQRYKGANGEHVQVTATADSPLVQMFGMWMNNPALLGENAELIKYGPYNAILKKEGNGWSLMILLGNSIVEAKGTRVSDDFLLKMFPQSRVDAMAKVLIS